MDSLRHGSLFLDFLTANWIDGVPGHIQHVLVCHSVKYPVAAENYEVMEVVFESELRYLRLCNYHALLTPVLWILRFNVSECSWHWKSTWQNSVRTKNVLLLGLSLDLDILNALCLVNAASILHDPLQLVFLVWPVISRKQEEFLSFVCRHDGSTVTHICHVALLLHYKHNDCTWAAPVMHRCLLVCIAHEHPLSLQTASCQSLRRVFRKALLVDDNQVQLIL